MKQIRTLHAHTYTRVFFGGSLPLASSGGVPPAHVFDLLSCLLLHQHKAVFVCLLHRVSSKVWAVGSAASLTASLYRAT